VFNVSDILDPDLRLKTFPRLDLVGTSFVGAGGMVFIVDFRMGAEG